MSTHEHPIILFDGICNFCNKIVNLIIRHDTRKIFRFAALQSDRGNQLLEEYNIDQRKIDSFILIDDKGVHYSSTAGLRLFNKLPWYWKWTQLGWIVPRVVRDKMYGVVAKNRYKLFGKKDQCMVPSADVRERFI